MPEFATVVYSTQGPVARISINRPDKRNALNVEVMRDLRGAFAAAKDDPDVRVAVLTGEGDQAFSAGGDLGGFTAEQSKVEQHLLRGELPRLFEDMRRLGKPVVARVQGHALAGGFGLMCACDIVIASEAATFGMPEINMGLWPFIITATVTRKIAPGKALELMMTGERLDAAAAERIGAVNSVVPAGELDAAVDAMCATLASRSPLVMRLGKDSFYAAEDMSLPDGLAYLHGMLGICLETEDVVEGVTAFFQKRDPVWKGR